ncbi:MAG: AsmA family protein, partial [Alphaproteobacteria bacterium]|nr:AsmA family protein [Alphaproteobacteria bacterium]
MARRRRGFLLRFVIGAVLVLLVAAVAAVGAAAWLIDPNAFKPQIEAAVQRATGRALALRGPIRIAYRLPPGIVAKDLTLANPPGFSRPDMARIGTLEARVALLPLLHGRVEITTIDLIGPDVLLERDAAGHDNWHFTPPAHAAAATPATGEATGSRPPRFAVGAVHIRQGQLGWRDAASGRTVTLGVPRLDLTPSGTETIAVAGDLLAERRTLALTGEVGSVAHLLDPAAATPWPVQLVLQGEAARLAVRGTIAHPLQGTGYALQVDLAATDLAPFAAFLPVPPPKLHDASFSARLADSGAKLPDVTAMTLHVAGLALGGVAIERADITAPGLKEPLNAEVHGTVAGQKLAMKATIGALAATLGLPGAKPAPVPVEASGTAGAAQFVVKGTLADPARLAGADLAFALRIADFAELRPLAGRDLPPWKNVALDGRIGGDLEGRGPLTLRGLALTTPPVQATGDLTWQRGPRPGLRGTIAAQHLDLDPLLAAFAPPHAAGGAAAPPATPRAKPTHLIPDTPIDFSALRAADADLQLAVAALNAGGVRYSDIAGHLVLKDGHLTLDPIAGTAPGGRVEGRLSADAATSDVALTLRAPALALQP